MYDLQAQFVKEKGLTHFAHIHESRYRQWLEEKLIASNYRLIKIDTPKNEETKERLVDYGVDSGVVGYHSGLPELEYCKCITPMPARGNTHCVVCMRIIK